MDREKDSYPWMNGIEIDEPETEINRGDSRRIVELETGIREGESMLQKDGPNKRYNSIHQHVRKRDTQVSPLTFDELQPIVYGNRR